MVDMNRFTSRANKKRRRDLSLDLLKAIAIVLMILAHSVAFFYNGDEAWMKSLQRVGDTICFTIFLFASGVSSYFAYFYKKKPMQEKRKSLLRRIWILIFGYYIVAIVSSIGSVEILSTSDLISYLTDIVLLKIIPGYTEFLIPFVVYSVLIYIFPNFLKNLARSNALVYVTGLGSFFLSLYLYYNYQAPAELMTYKSIFVGQEGLYSFPILSYFIVFLLGLNWGYRAKHYESRKSLLSQAISGAFYVLLLAVVISFYGHQQYAYIDLDIINRWPPSFGFLALGLVPVYLFIAFYEKNRNTVEDYEFKLIHFLGRKVFAFYVIHIIILQIQYILFKFKTDAEWFVFVLFLLLMLAVSTVALIIDRVTISPTENNKYITYRLNWGGLFSMSLLVVAMAAAAGLTAASFDLARESSAEETEDQIIAQKLVDVPENVEARWVDDYSMYKNVLYISNNSGGIIPANEVVTITFPHKKTVSEAKSQADASDIRLFYLGATEPLDVPVHIVDANTNQMKINFALQKDLSLEEMSFDYEVYYGADIARQSNQTAKQLINTGTFDVEVALQPEIEHPYRASFAKEWVLIGDELSVDQTTIELKVANSDKANNHTFDFILLETRQKGIMQYNSKDNNYTIKISSEDLTPGIFEVQAVSKNNPDVKSNIVSFKASYPLYVVWSIDWEGYDTAQRYLDMMDEISAEYEIPMSHFYNPRIYVPGAISSANVERYDNYIKSRRDNHGDSIGLHLHMFFDMVEEMGVEPRKEGQYGNYGDGKDIPMSVYTVDEAEQMLYWSIEKFRERGFGTPLGFRAGGWFADIDTLQAVENSGFLYDTSGRTAYYLGPTEGPWDLDPTMTPFQPSVFDQNSSARPHFDIWEFPNNGADSWRFSGAEMIERFKMNYQTEIMNEPQVLIYLSHPHGFNVDYPKMKEVFNYTSKFKYVDDNGPVVYTNLDNAAKAWLE